MLLLRTDIYSILNDPDLNKIKIDNSIELNWGHRADMHSPLIDLILLKIRRSVSEFGDISRNDMFNKLFPQVD